MQTSLPLRCSWGYVSQHPRECKSHPWSPGSRARLTQVAVARWLVAFIFESILSSLTIMEE